MRVPLRRGRRSVLATVVPVGLVLSAALTWNATYAAFSDSTENPGNSWQAGSVVLTDNDSDVALFTSADNGGLTPGATRSQCIRLDYAGTVTADIRMYVTMPAGGATTLDRFLVMSVERGEDVDDSTPVAPDCTTGFRSTTPSTFLFNTRQADDGANQADTLATLRSHADYATGRPLGSPVAGGTSLTLRITYLVKDDNDAQRTRSDATITWEARNT